MDILNVQVRRIDGDLAELFFNPREADLRVGETLTLHERATGHSVIAQVIAFRSASFPSLVLDQLHHLVGPEQVHAPLLEAIGVQLQLPDRLDDGDRAMGDIKVALAKIRKTVHASASQNGHGHWEQWDGWIPARDVEVVRTSDREVFANSTRDLGHRLRLGRTQAGHDFFIEGQDLEKVNVISGVKGSGKSHLSKVVLLRLIAQGAPCVVFDINKEYIHLPKAETDPATGKTLKRGIVHLEAGGNFRLSVRQFGLAPMMTLMSNGQPEGLEDRLQDAERWLDLTPNNRKTQVNLGLPMGEWQPPRPHNP